MIRHSDRRPAYEQGWFGPKKTASGPIGYPPPRRARNGRRGAAPVDAQQQLLARAALLAAAGHGNRDSDEHADVLPALTGAGTGRRNAKRASGWQVTNTTSRQDRRRARRAVGGGIVHRNRRQLVPHLAAVAALTTAALAHAIASATGVQTTTTAATAAITVTAGAAGFWLLRRTNKLPARWTTWALLLAAATAAWLTVTVAVGLSWPMLAVLLGIDYAFGARWWARHRHPNPTVAPARSHRGEKAQQEEAKVPAAWRETVGASDGVLAGSRLVNAEPAEHGTMYTLQLRPGKQALSDVLAALGKIASGLRIPVEQLLAEAHPSRDPSQVRFQVITASPVEAPVFFTGPRFDNGCVVLGPYADGVTDALWRLYSHKSMWGGMVIGGTGSGKSRLLEVIALVAMFTGHTYVIHVDGQDGQSCPLLWQHAAEHAGADDADAMLGRLERMQRHRQAAAGAAGKAGFRPRPDYPGILVVVDEAHAVITNQNAERWAKIAREARKVGIAVVMGDQDGTLETFKKDVLRSSLMAGNCVGLRTNSRSQGQILGDGKFNLRDLPKIPGFGYTIATDDTGRTAPYRGQWLPDADDAEELTARGEPLPDGVRLIEHWYTDAPSIDLDAGTATAGEQATRRGGTPAPVAAPAPAVPFVPAPAAPAQPELSVSQAKVLDALAGGVEKPSAIAEQVGLTRQQVTTLLGRLAESGHVTRAEYGRYTLAGQRPA